MDIEAIIGVMLVPYVLLVLGLRQIMLLGPGLRLCILEVVGFSINSVRPLVGYEF